MQHLEFVREAQPRGHEGVQYSVQKMIELINKDRTDPSIVAFARRALRDAGVIGQENQDPVKVARAVWDAMKKRGIGWVPDPVRSEFLAAPRHFLGTEGQDDALMVAGDCDELTMLQACVGLAAMMSVGVETSALCLHSYSPSGAIGHVLNAVYDPNTGVWVRIDHTGNWNFGDFKTPTHEVLISLPSGRVICSAKSCTRATPAPATGDEPWDHGRLEGLPRSSASPAVLGTLGEIFDEEDALQFQRLLDLQSWDLASAVGDLDLALYNMNNMFEALELSPLERDSYWTLEQDSAATSLFRAAEVAEKALYEVRNGMRRWALDDDGGYAIERKKGESWIVSAKGYLVKALELDDEPEPPPGLSGAPPLPPVLIGVLGVGAVVLTIAGFYALVESLRQMADMARTAELRAANDVIAKCLQGGHDPEKCARVGVAVKEVRESRERAEAEKEKQIAAQKSETTRQLGMVLGFAAVASAAGAFVYFGGPALVSGWIASMRSKKAAA